MVDIAQQESPRRSLLDVTWPTRPRTWREVVPRVGPPLANLVRFTAAAVIAYLLTLVFTDGPIDLTGSLTALIVMQASAVDTFRMGLVRVGAVLTGVGISLGVSIWVGLSWWSLALVIFLALLAARVFRLGPQSIETAISAMLILGASGTDIAAEVRVITSLIGASVGVVFPLIVPPAIPRRSVSAAVRHLTRQHGDLLRRVGAELRAAAPTAAGVEDWIDESRGLTTELGRVADDVHDLQKRQRLNPRAIGSADIAPLLRSGLDTIERCQLAIRNLLLTLAHEAPLDQPDDDEVRGEVREAFAVVLDDVADCLDDFGALVQAEADGDRHAARDRFQRSLVTLDETRAVLTDLMTVDPGSDTRMWLFRGSVLASVDQVLQHLSVQARERQNRQWRSQQVGKRQTHGRVTEPDPATSGTHVLQVPVRTDPPPGTDGAADRGTDGAAGAAEDPSDEVENDPEITVVRPPRED